MQENMNIDSEELNSESKDNFRNFLMDIYIYNILNIYICIFICTYIYVLNVYVPTSLEELFQQVQNKNSK